MSWQRISNRPRISVWSSAVSCRWHNLITEVTWCDIELNQDDVQAMWPESHVSGVWEAPSGSKCLTKKWRQQEWGHQHCCGESAKGWWTHTMESFRNSTRPWLITTARQPMWTSCTYLPLCCSKLPTYYTVSLPVLRWPVCGSLPVRMQSPDPGKWSVTTRVHSRCYAVGTSGTCQITWELHPEVGNTCVYQWSEEPGHETAPPHGTQDVSWPFPCWVFG